MRECVYVWWPVALWQANGLEPLLGSVRKQSLIAITCPPPLPPLRRGRRLTHPFAVYTRPIIHKTVTLTTYH